MLIVCENRVAPFDPKQTVCRQDGMVLIHILALDLKEAFLQRNVALTRATGLDGTTKEEKLDMTYYMKAWNIYKELDPEDEAQQEKYFTPLPEHSADLHLSYKYTDVAGQ
jgi:hypothetical protein